MAVTHRLDDLTVAQLRQLARERGIKGYSKLKKADLVKTLQGAESTEPSPAPQPSTAATWPSQTDSAPAGGDHGDDRRTTSDHEEIRAWAEARGAVPATDEGAWDGAQPGALRFRFPHSPTENLQQIDWLIWFRTFDNRRLMFIYRDPAHGSRTNEFELQHR
jgi:Rho termination factor, N-terminal domain